MPKTSRSGDKERRDKLSSGVLIVRQLRRSVENNWASVADNTQST